MNNIFLEKNRKKQNVSSYKFVLQLVVRSNLKRLEYITIDS